MADFIVFDTIIIGAGAAGLQCYHDLINPPNTNIKPLDPSKVLILEGRNRLGGRLYTDEQGDDLGAKYIHGTSRFNPVMKLLTASPGPLRHDVIDIAFGNPWLFPRQHMRTSYFVGGMPPTLDNVNLSYIQYENLMRSVGMISQAGRDSMHEDENTVDDGSRISLKDTLEMIRKEVKPNLNLKGEQVNPPNSFGSLHSFRFVHH